MGGLIIGEDDRQDARGWIEGVRNRDDGRDVGVGVSGAWDCLLGRFYELSGPILQVIWNCILRRWEMVVKG